MDAMEVKIHRLNTKAFIDHRPTIVKLARPTFERAKTGGTKAVADTPLAGQTMRIVQQTTSNMVVTLTDGTQREVEFVLLAEFDADMQRDDFWKDEATGRYWVIGDVVRDNEYERRGLVVERGK